MIRLSQHKKVIPSVSTNSSRDWSGTEGSEVLPLNKKDSLFQRKISHFLLRKESRQQEDMK